MLVDRRLDGYAGSALCLSAAPFGRLPRCRQLRLPTPRLHLRLLQLGPAYVYRYTPQYALPKLRKQL